MRKIIFVIAIVPRLNDSIFTFIHHVSQYPIILIRNHRSFGCSSFIYLLGCYSFTITRQKPTLHAFRALIRLQRELCDKHEFCWNLTTLTRGPPTTEFLRDMMNIVTSIIFSSFRPIHFNLAQNKFYFSYLPFNKLVSRPSYPLLFKFLQSIYEMYSWIS